MEIDVPCVMITNSAEALDFPNLSSVCIDDTQAAETAIEYLISLGHRKIGILGGELKGKLIAVFSMSDVMALGAIRAAKDRGLRVPEDISIIGFDGIEMGQYLCRSSRRFNNPQ